MIDQMKMEKIVLVREGFNPLTLRKVIYTNETYFYEMLCYTRRDGSGRYEKINLPIEDIENQINVYKEKTNV